MAGTAASLQLGVSAAVHQTLLSAEQCPILHAPLPSYKNAYTRRGLWGSTSAVSNLKPTEFEIQ